MTVLRRLVLTGLASVFVLAIASGSLAQEKPKMSKEQQAMMDAMTKAATPGPNHKLLAEVVGDWTFVTRMWMDPGQPPTETKGTATFQPLLGGRYVRGDFKASMMGMDFEGVALNGYDNVANEFVSLWFDNMSTGMMLMNGKYDSATKTFTYTGEMADPMNPTAMIKYREVVRITSPDSHVMEMYEMRGGKEVKTMESSYTRVK